MRIDICAMVLVSLSVLAQSNRPQLSVPNDVWEPTFFMEIDQVAAQGHLADLRREGVPYGDMEVRVWEFSRRPLRGYVIRSHGNAWTADYLEKGKDARRMDSTKSWADVWQRMRDAGILDIRDASERPPIHQLDGVSYVIEFCQDFKYRTVKVNDLRLDHSDDASKMGRVITILHEAFGQVAVETDGGRSSRLRNGMGEGTMHDGSTAGMQSCSGQSVYRFIPPASAR
jgi:hypothetical protein